MLFISQILIVRVENHDIISILVHLQEKGLRENSNISGCCSSVEVCQNLILVFLEKSFKIICWNIVIDCSLILHFNLVLCKFWGLGLFSNIATNVIRLTSFLFLILVVWIMLIRFQPTMKMECLPVWNLIGRTILLHHPKAVNSFCFDFLK